MIRQSMLLSAALLTAACLTGPAYAGQASGTDTTKKSAHDPNAKICEDIVATGSRIAVKRYCGTRAEWEDKRKQDRDAVERAQTQLIGPCQTINTHSGAPAC